MFRFNYYGKINVDSIIEKLQHVDWDLYKYRQQKKWGSQRYQNGTFIGSYVQSFIGSYVQRYYRQQNNVR